MSFCIKNEKISEATKIPLDIYNWGFTDYPHKVYAKLVYNEKGFEIEFEINETNPLREKTQHFEAVSDDSCVEFFVNFDPENSNEYINFEVNANGAMRADIRTDRYKFKHLEAADIEGLGIDAKINVTNWTVSYHISEELIKKYYPGFSMTTCNHIMCNLYKCGRNTGCRHYLTIFELKCEKPDFHRPEYFGRIDLV